MMEYLTERWFEVANKRNWLRSKTTEAWEVLVSAYATPPRDYHNLNHIRDCLEMMNRFEGCIEEPELLELAIWFHDAIYDPKANDNEMQSALLAKAELTKLGESAEFSAKVERLIIVTDHKTEAATGDEKILIDIDLSILGSERSNYREYAAAIRSEYGWVNDDDYRKGRCRVLEAFRRREVIFHHQIFREKMESQARQNLEWELAQLKKSEA